MSKLSFIITTCFLIFIATSCALKEDPFIINFDKTEGLTLSFYSKTDTSFLLDLKAFSQDCFNKENENLIKICGKNIDSISSKVNFNQAILVDQNNDMRFLSDYFSLTDKIEEVVDINCMHDWIIQINLKAGVQNSFLIDYISLSDLMVTEKSIKTKIIYINKNNDETQDIMESNWMQL